MPSLKKSKYNPAINCGAKYSGCTAVWKNLQLDHHGFCKLISGQKGGLSAKILRSFLGCAAAFYSVAIWLRTSLYSKGLLKTHCADAKVISIGNITVGGTGKTPLVIWLCNLLQRKKIRCVILTRGYKATKNSKLKTQNYFDEPAILSQGCPEAKVVVNPDRVAAAAEAVDKFGAEVLIMDDGFQHWRLAREPGHCDN